MEPVESAGSEASVASVAALPTSKAGDFYSLEALRRRVPSPDPNALPLQVAASTQATRPRVKLPPVHVMQGFTQADWADFRAYHLVVEQEPLQLSFPAKVS